MDAHSTLDNLESTDDFVQFSDVEEAQAFEDECCGSEDDWLDLAAEERVEASSGVAQKSAGARLGSVGGLSTPAPAVLASVPTWAGGTQTPVGNTGVTLTNQCLDNNNLKIDWSSFSFPADKREAVLDLVKPFLKEPVPLKYGRHTYRESVQFPTKALICWTEGRREALLSFNGDSCDLIPVAKKPGLFLALWKLGAKCTRLDLAFDELKRLASMDEIHAAAEVGNFSGFRTQDPRRPKKDGKLQGDSIYFGKAGKSGGGRMLCIYDKAIESGGEIDGIRYELRLYKQHAHEAFIKLVALSSVEAWSTQIGQLIGGSINFIERGSETHLDRMPRLTWWASILKVLGEASLTVHRVIPPLQKSWEYLKRCILPTLSLIKTVVDGEAVIAFMDHLEYELDTAAERINWARQGHRDLGINLVECFG